MIVVLIASIAAFIIVNVKLIAYQKKRDELLLDFREAN